MNLQHLFELQAGLDLHIEKEHPRQNGEDRLAKKILALQVELGELTNEWRGFKFWSNDQEPRTKIICDCCDGRGYFDTGLVEYGTPYTEGCIYCQGTGYQVDGNPLLEEYVDCLHFILSIGLELEKLYGFEMIVDFMNENHSNDTVNQFNNVFSSVSSLYMSIDDEYYDNADKQGIYEELLESFLSLGEMLGFTWDQVEQAYYKKNKINHERQMNNY